MANEQRFSALYVRDFRLFWLGQVISLSGTWMHSVAQSWLVYSLTKSPLFLGIIASLSSLPILLFSLIGGTVADRYPKRNILIVTQFLSLLSALTVGILADKNVITVWQIGIVALFLGTVNAFDVPTRQSFLVEVAGMGGITSAIALNSAAFNGARIIGPVIAGFFIANIGIPACFYANALSFVAVIVALWKIRAKAVINDDKRSLSSDIVGGWNFIVKEKTIFSIMSLVSVFSLFGIPYVTLLPILAGEILNVGAKGLSFLVASGGVGALLAAITIAFKGEINQNTIYIPLSGFVFSFSILGLSLSTNFSVSLILIFLAGLGITSFLASSNSVIQHIVPNELRGRVMSVYTMVFLGFAPLGNSVIGFTANAIGTTIAVRLFAIVCVLGTLLFSRTFMMDRRMRRQ